MEACKIQSADLLDIIFDGRNKSYGAYLLRKNYNSRLATSLMLMMFIVVLSMVLLSLTQRQKEVFVSPVIIDPTLVDISPPKPLPSIQKVIIRPAVTPKVENTKPIIVNDNKVSEPLPAVEEFTDINIDTKSNNGDVVTGIDAPIEIKGSSVLEVPVVKNNADSTFIDVQIPATFKGDWNSYVKEKIEKSSDELINAGESGTCLIQFIVSTDGTVSNVEALTMKGSKFAEIAVAAIRNGPKWRPAQNNGHVVKAYRKQPVTFTIEE